VSGAARARASAFADTELAASAPAFLLSFGLVLILGADSGGYWPTAWDWTALILLFVCAVVLIVRSDLRIGSLEAVLPGGLLALTLWEIASAAWSPSATAPVLGSQRTLSYAAAVFAALLIVRIGTYRAFLGGVCTAITLVCGYGLLTRLLPERLGHFDDSLAGQRLEAPLGYWNALAIFAAIGTVLAVGFLARGRHPLGRALAAAATVVLVPTLYFTFSRGGWLALAVGLVVMIALDSRRLQLITAAAVVAPWPALAVWHASRIDALTHVGLAEAAAEHQGHGYLLFLAVVAFGAGVTAVAYAVLETRVRIPRPVRIAYVVLLLLVLAAAAGAVVQKYGSPTTIARKGYDNLVGQDHPITNGDLNTRLFSLGLGQRIPQFKVAWHEYKAHPYLGTSEGSYERYWNQNRPYAFKVKNVHNLYLETLAELGPVGLALLLVALAAPIVAFFRARRRELAAVALGGYAAFLAHALVDWDWQMPAVSLAALFCGTAILSAAKREKPKPMGPLSRGILAGLVIVLGVFAFVALRSNVSLAATGHAMADGKYARAVSDARAARSWAPWSATPWQLEGEAQLALGKRAAARASLLRAIAKDDSSWETWLDLAIASDGAQRRHAFAEATRLNPLGDEISSWKATLG
jgi:O-antigen ligase